MTMFDEDEAIENRMTKGYTALFEEVGRLSPEERSALKRQLIITERLSESEISAKDTKRVINAVKDVERIPFQSPEERIAVIEDDGVLERYAKIVKETPRDVWRKIGGPPGLDVQSIAAKLIAKHTILVEDELLITPRSWAQLCYGLVQLGKSAIRNAVMILVGYWDLVDLVIVSTGRDDSARPMQIDRANNFLEGWDVFESSDGKDITESNAMEAVEDVQVLLENNRKVVLFTKSNSDTLPGAEQLARTLKERMANLRVMLIADEADEAHLPLRKSGSGSAAELKRDAGIHRAFTRLAKYADCGVIWFTATPMTLLIQPKTWSLYPRRVTAALPEKNSAYFDCYRFLSIQEHVIDPWLIYESSFSELDDNESIDQVPRWALEHLIHHVVTEAMRWPNLADKPDVNNGGSHISLVNPGLQRQTHREAMKLLKFARRRVLTILGNKIETGRWKGRDAELICEILDSVTAQLMKSENSLGSEARHHRKNFDMEAVILLGPPYRLERLVESLVSTKIQVMNQKQGGDWEERRPNAILIAGQRIGRGVSAQGLVGFSMPWRPKLFNHDTQGQRLRFQGQRGPLINLFRIALLPETVEDISRMTFSELGLRANLKELDTYNVDLRSIDIPYLTDPQHAPAGPSRLGNAQHGEAAAASQSSTMRFKYVRYDKAKESVLVEQSGLRRFAELVRDLGHPDVVHEKGHVTWHGVSQRKVRDLLNCTSDHRRYKQSLVVECADEPLSVTLIAGLGHHSTKLPRRLSRLYGKPTGEVRRRVSTDVKDAAGNKTGDTILNLVSDEQSGDWLYATVESSYSDNREADLALDGFGDRSGKRKSGEPGHAVFYPTQLTRLHASSRDAEPIDGGVAILAAVAMSDDIAEDAHRSEWLNVSEAPEEDE